MMFVYAAVGVGALRLLQDEAVAETEQTMSAQARLYGGIEERITASEDLRSNGAGTGLSNVRSRLNALYAGRASMTLEENDPHGVVVTVVLPRLEQ